MADKLTAGQYKHLGDLCLSKQLRVTMRETGVATEWLALLQGLYGLKHLSDTQTQCYFDQSISDVGFNVRLKVRAGGPLPLRLSVRLTSGIWAASEFEDPKLRFDVSNERIRLHHVLSGQVRDYLFVSSWPGKKEHRLPWVGWGEWSSSRCGEIDVPAGKYTLAYSATLEFQTVKTAMVVWSKEVQFKREIRVEWDDADDVVRIPPTAEELNRLQGILSVRGGDWLIESDDALGKVAMSDPENILEFDLTEFLPVPVAFDVEIYTPTQSYPIGWIAAGNGDSKVRSEFRWAEVPAIPRSSRGVRFCDVMVKLRASDEVARQTCDLYAIWDGELTLGPIHMGLPITPATLPPP
ncbi:MAG: hypothetical protein AABZ08_02540 [Planctomycetota bacterium]